MGLLMPGLGQVYNGEIIKGLSVFIISLVISIFGAWGTVLLPDSMLLFGSLATFLAGAAIYIAAIFDSCKQASTTDAVYQLRPYNRWYFYLAAWLLGIVVMFLSLGYIRENYLAAYKIPTRSMEPAILPGDHLLADKTAYRRMPPKAGDIVVFFNPDDRSKLFIKRIEALPGAVITNADSTTSVVPHGFVYVLGDNRKSSKDSRQFGFLPLSDIVGKARQIYFSSGPDGIRWSRIGKTVGSR